MDNLGATEPEPALGLVSSMPGFEQVALTEELEGLEEAVQDPGNPGQRHHAWALEHDAQERLERHTRQIEFLLNGCLGPKGEPLWPSAPLGRNDVDHGL